VSPEDYKVKPAVVPVVEEGSDEEFDVYRAHYQSADESNTISPRAIATALFGSLCIWVPMAWIAGCL
jgi:hypothetical protein